MDRPPIANPTNVATVELMDMMDAPFPDACRDPELAARLAATGHTELGFDSVMPYFSIIQESSALGCEMQWEEKDNWPTVRMYNPIWKGPDDVHVPSGFLEHPDNVTITRSIEMLRQEFGDEVAVIGKTMGPWTLAYHVFGVESFLLMTVDDPGMVMRAMHKLKEISVTLRRGADRRRRRRADLSGPRHGGPGQRRVLPAVPAGDTPGDGRAPQGAPDTAHLRRDAGPPGLHRPDRHGLFPLRLQEQPAGGHGHRRGPHRPRGGT